MHNGIVLLIVELGVGVAEVAALQLPDVVGPLGPC